MEVHPNEDFDIFVSYASADNDMPAPYDQWVSHFVDFLGKHLKARLGGEKPNIYFDQRSLEPNHVLQEILSACRRSKILLVIASTAYHRRKWTQMEVGTFIEANPDPRCLFIIELPKEEDTREIEALQPGLGRRVERFYREDFAAKTPIWLRPGDQDFYIKQSDLAAAIVRQLITVKVRQTTLKSEGPHPEAIPKESSSTKFLSPVLIAQTTDDLEEERQMVRRYLEQFDVSVLPASDYPQGGEAFQEAFSADLANAHLVVQLLGPRAGRTPPDLPVGYARYQAYAAREKKVPLMQWRRGDVRLDAIADPAHRGLLTGVDVIATTLPDFNQEILKRLKQKPAPQEKTSFLVFLNAERSDQAAAKELHALLKDYWVYTPLGGPEESIQGSFNEALSDCDVLLTLYGQAECDWVNRQMLYLRKARAGLPQIPVAVCLGPPSDKPEIGVSFPGFRQVDCRTPDGAKWAVDMLKELLLELRK